MLTSREKVNNIINRKNSAEHVSGYAFWTGHPSDTTVSLFAKEWNIEPTREAIFTYLNDDCRWIPADTGYTNPDGIPLFDPTYGNTVRKSLSAEGCFANAKTLSDIENYPWPDVSCCDFSSVYEQIDKFQDKMVFTGLWSCFFNIATNFFGMENYFIKMYEAPDIIKAVNDKITDFYADANEKFFSGLGDRADVMFFGNDFGTQRDLLVSPDKWREFVLPSLKRLIAIGRKYNKKIMLHSCGSIYRIIPDLIDAGIDILHPIQAKAKGMSAVELAQYKNDLIFAGGIDAQAFIVNATPQQVEDEVHRVREILKPGIIISPSHEEILPNIPAANIFAISKAAHN